ncbi:MAG: TetR family transcriptional regulator C-terminal domain-containing protein [Oscillospiraceae bacterium]|nr:TetR family transcriptional regulator C-terminal domain-containing protein [Oscillospiraceae bacterium]
MNRPNNKRFQKTENRLIEHTLELIEQYPDRPLTVTAICEALSVNRTSFYLHHKSVQSVLDAVMRQVREEFLRECQADDASLSAAVRRSFLFASRHQSFFRYYIRFSENPDLGRQYLWECLDTLVSSLPDRNEMTELQFSYLSEFVQSGMSSVISCWLSSDDRASLDEIVDLFTRLLRRMEAKTASD